MKKEKKTRAKKLSTQIGVMTGIIVLVCMVICNVILIYRFSQGLNKSVNAQFDQISHENVLKIESVLEECEQISDTINYQVKYLFDMQKKGGLGNAYIDSKVSGKLTSLHKESEDVILAALWSAVEGNENLEAAGLFLEPYAFSKDIQNYSPYVVKSDVANRKLTNFDYNVSSQREYYNGARGGNIAFMDAYYDVNNVLMYSIGYPVMYNGEFKGVVLLDLRADLFSMLNTVNEDYPSMFVDLVRSNGNLIYSTQGDCTGINLRDFMSDESFAVMSNGFAAGESFHASLDDGNIHYASPVTVGAERWWVNTTVSESEYNALIYRIIVITVITAAISIAVIILIVTVMLKKVLAPLTHLEKAALTMAQGSLNVSIEYNEQDEIGSLANSMRTMMERTRNVMGDLRYNLNEMANANFALKMTNKDIYVGDYQPMIVALENITEKLNHTLVNVKVASAQVNSGAEQVSDGAQALSQGATEQASTVEELSATMMTISDETRESAAKSQEANSLSEAMRNEVIRSNEKMAEMSEAMQDITEKSNEIGKIIKAIEDIAFQTNILALNAAVEAARAGAAGKGFAVVADEVRNLAGKSAEAAKNTTALIDGTMQSVANGGRITEETAAALNVVAENVEKVSALIDNIAQSANDQAVRITQATEGLEQISSVVQNNSATAEQSAAASEELSSQANMMNNLISAFKLNENCEML